MPLPGVLSIHADVMAQQLGDETVILHLRSGTYFGLGPIGTRVWQLIEKGHGLDEILDVLVLEFEVERLQLEHDIDLLVQDLLAHELIQAA
jgi:hypothetical protein